MENKNANYQNDKDKNENDKDYVMSREQLEYENEIRRRIKERRSRLEKRRVKRNRVCTVAVLIVIILIIVKACTGGSDSKSGNESSSTSKAEASQTDKQESAVENKKGSSSSDGNSSDEHTIEQTNGMTFVDGILIVNKTYSLPSDYDPGISTVAQNAFDEMSAASQADGISLFVNSGYRSYQEQEELYNSYADSRGTEAADEVSSRPGHSEHQTGLTFDVNSTEFSFDGTPEAEWLAEHCVEYGFIIRYPEGKEDITGYSYEPWHIRYLGVDTAKAVSESGLCLEEYLGVTSDYKYADDM